MNSSASPQHDLRDLLRPIRAQRWLLLIVVLVAVFASIAYSAAETPKYSATASLQYLDQSQDLGLVGIQAAPTLTATQLASQLAQTVAQPKVAGLVRSALHSRLGNSQLEAEISTSVDANSNLVHIQATAPTASGAQALANAFADATTRVANAAQRQIYAAAAGSLRKHRPPKSNVTSTLVYQDNLGRLQALATIASPAQIVTSAAQPSSPSSPRPLTNAFLAGVLGLLLGLLIVYTRDSLDRRLRSGSDVAEQFDYELVGHVRDEALGHSPKAAGSGNAVEAADWEQFRILRRNLDFLGQGDPPRMLAVTSAMPDEGKTTVALFAAFATAATGRRVLLIECDLRRPVLAKRLGINATPGITDFVLGDAQPGEIVQVVGFDDRPSGNGAGRRSAAGEQRSDLAAGPAFRHEVVCIVAGTHTEHPVEVLESKAFRAMLDQVRQAYDVVILDTPPLLPVVDALEVIPKADAVIVCGRATRLTREQARAGKAALDRLPHRPTGLVITGIRRSDEEYSGGYYAYRR